MFARQIVDNLQSPDIVVLEEIQDNNGSVDDGSVDANLTYRTLADEILNAGGPQYIFRDIPPENNQDGGEQGGNIRVGFLFRTDRGLEFVDRAGKFDQGVKIITKSDGVQLNQSPARIKPSSDAFINSRKPIVGEFRYHEIPIFIVGLHLNSKGTDSALYGRLQPPNETSARQRLEQAYVVNKFVEEMLGLDKNARVIVAGDLNDFQFSEAAGVLAGSELTNAIELLPAKEQYTFVFEGNSQVLDQILVSEKLIAQISTVDIVHINSEFPARDRVSDHDPVLLYLELAAP